MPSRTGAQHLIDALSANGVERIFGVPGESYLAALDALVDAGIPFIQCRHEAGAANMAEAHGKLTGRPGICFVTRGPGATQAAVGVHTALQDSTPMILLVGQVRREDEGREAFQELDYGQAFAGLAKAAFEIRDPARVPEMMMRAFSLAMNGRPGPVVVGLPEDMLTEIADAPAAAALPMARSEVSASTAAEIAQMIDAADRPVVMVGGPGWRDEDRTALHAFAEQMNCPVITSFRVKHLFDNKHSHYGGEAGIGACPAVVGALREADLIVAIGPRLGEMTTQSYDLFDVPEGVADRLVHIHPGGEELGRVYRPKLAVTAQAGPALSSIHAASRPERAATRSEWVKQCRAAYDAWIEPVEVTGDVNPSIIWRETSEKLGGQAIMTNGAGNFAAWLHRFWVHQCCPSQLAPTSGAMGYGLPAAIAAKLHCPDRPVIAVCGDGDFMMAAPELATAVQHGANIVVCVFDNGAYGTIRMHQERAYPGRVSGTDLANPDFKLMAEACGCAGYFVDKTEDFAAALDQALNAGKPALIHVKQSLADIAPGKTLSLS
ncbi:MAG: thiamine pyrophosphate-binding protein [Oceanicaulis sp.]|uniref:thiamine pyrophosphate-dependent enzyme n=1 Tax=unclassified Oceanicaulis TaxID=2632123 RepID=UPI000C5D4603|nr:MULTISPECIES: thiamine pyrophosphate-dependent enzyme [unclassified Oceanicaulis]MAB69196.1 thiamine pyrophosphate-binding protein [Oceanicaulis sp.]MBC38452.1 thiamine pyrophosphate-binding protein [Oceanicaulis sp.]MBG35459.1 thiamine pyrophosphate-binding protein [Oceanicaulis sp.]HCR94328.1 thiamine pyrophosphate-binding protein [Oceanicaulis sp.]